MRLVTYTSGSNGTARAGVRVGHRILDIEGASRVNGEPLPSGMRALLGMGRGALSRVQALVRAAQTGAGLGASMVEEKAVRFLPPVPDPDKFLCVGKNYRAHLEELKKHDLIKEMPEEVTGFVKILSCLVGHDARVVKPAAVERLDYEPELVFVIGKRALGFNANEDDAMDYAVGVTLLNDLTDRDMQKREVASGSRFWTSKNAPGFGPVGPEIVTMDEIGDPYDLWLTCSVNGEERMRVNTGDQIWKLPQILEHFSRTMPIEPGDMFSTGAPGGVAVGKPNAQSLFLQPGDIVECSIEGITTLRTYIV